MAAQLVLALEFSEDEAVSGEEFTLNVVIRNDSEESEPLVKIEGRVGVNVNSNDGVGYLPLVLNTSEVEIPVPGKYRIEVTADQADGVNLTFYARLADTAATP